MYHEFLRYDPPLPEVNLSLSSVERYVAFGGKACLCQCEFNISKCDIEVAANLRIKIPISILRSVPKRQAEFIAGRYMAKLCLNALSTSDYDIAIGTHRQPLWPELFTGAISHNSDRALALVTEKTAYSFVGIDVENWINTKTAMQISSEVCDKVELALFQERGISFQMATSIIFSAKETLFKATFPYIGRYFGFECAHITEVNVEEQSLLLKLALPLSHFCADRQTFKCYYFTRSLDVTTMILC